MKKILVIAFILFSSLSVMAQKTDEPKATAAGQDARFAKRSEPERTINGPAKRQQTTRVVDGRVLRVGPTTTYLKNGLSAEEVLKLLGKPALITERQEGNRHLVVYTFRRSEDRVLIAEFEGGLLVGSRMEPAGL